MFVKVGAKLEEVIDGTPADGAMYYIPVGGNGGSCGQPVQFGAIAIVVR